MYSSNDVTGAALLMCVCVCLGRWVFDLGCFFPRMREFMAFSSEVLIDRTAAGQRQSVKEQGTSCMIDTHI